MNKIEEIKQKIKILEQQLWSAKEELMDVCPHNRARVSSISHFEALDEYEAFDECALTCLDCGMVIISDDPKHCCLNKCDIVDKPLA